MSAPVETVDEAFARQQARERARADALADLDCAIAALATPGYMGESTRYALAGRLTAARVALGDAG